MESVGFKLCVCVNSEAYLGAQGVWNGRPEESESALLGMRERSVIDDPDLQKNSGPTALSFSPTKRHAQW